MTMYRVAWKRNDIALWQWKSTKLGTLHAVLGFLRLYHMIPVERMRVFSSFSLEDLDEQLRQENEREALLIAEQVQQEQQVEERTIHTGKEETTETEETVETEERVETIREAFEVRQRRQEQEALVARLTHLPTLWNENMPYVAAFNGSIDWAAKRRLEYELGAGGDYDVPYVYTLPESFPLRLAWTRLLGKVQRGELEP